jgi:hypothetical protein
MNDMTMTHDLRLALAQAQEVAADSREVVDQARAAWARAQATLDGLEIDLANARDHEHEAEQAEIERMHAAARAGEDLAVPLIAPVASSSIEHSMRPVRGLVARLQGELDEKRAAAEQDALAVDRIVSQIMAAEAEVVAADLWRARQRVEALRARLVSFTATRPPHLANVSATRRVTTDLGGGNVLHEDIPTNVSVHFVQTPLISGALWAPPVDPEWSGLAPPLAVRDFAPSQAETDVWTTWAAALRSDHSVPIPPAPEPESP